MIYFQHILLHPLDSIRWMLWISLCDADDNDTTMFREIFTVTTLTKNFLASFHKFAGYIHNHKILPRNIFGLILKTRWPPRVFFRLSARTFVGPLERRVLLVEIYNSQDMFLFTKS